MMKIYDKAQWHTDAGENENIVLARFNAVFAFLHENKYLSDEGIEIYDLGIDGSISLHERLLTIEGNRIIDLYYDSVISLDPTEIESALKKLVENA